MWLAYALYYKHETLASIAHSQVGHAEVARSTEPLETGG